MTSSRTADVDPDVVDAAPYVVVTCAAVVDVVIGGTTDVVDPTPAVVVTCTAAVDVVIGVIVVVNDATELVDVNAEVVDVEVVVGNVVSQVIETGSHKHEFEGVIKNPVRGTAQQRHRVPRVQSASTAHPSTVVVVVVVVVSVKGQLQAATQFDDVSRRAPQNSMISQSLLTTQGIGTEVDGAGPVSSQLQCSGYADAISLH